MCGELIIYTYISNWGLQQCWNKYTLFSARLMAVTGKFRLPIRRLSKSTNRQSYFSSHSHESRAKKAWYLRMCRKMFILTYISNWWLWYLRLWDIMSTDKMSTKKQKKIEIWRKKKTFHRGWTAGLRIFLDWRP